MSVMSDKIVLAPKVQVNVRIPADLAERLSQVAQLVRRDKGELVEKALEDFLNRVEIPAAAQPPNDGG